MLGRVRLCCEVLVNVCVCEPGLVKEDETLVNSAELILKLFLEGTVNQRVVVSVNFSGGHYFFYLST